MVMDILLSLPFPLPLFILLVGSVCIPLISILSDKIGTPRVRSYWTLLVASLSLVSIFVLYTQLMAAPNNILVFQIWGQLPPLGGCFEVDMLGLFMAFSISFLGLLVTIYTISYMKSEQRLTEFYSLLMLVMAGMLGVVFAGDMLTLFVFWEMMSITSYILVAFLKDTWRGIEAGFKYLIMSSMAGAFILLSMSLLYGFTGSLNFATLASTLKGAPLSPWFILLFSVIIVGFGVKSAIVPLHTWLPDAYSEAPDPISALLAGIATETALFALTRVLYLIFEPSVFMIPVAIFAIATMSLGNILALRQDDLKRLLAYSSIAQIGYMLIGVSTGLAYGLFGTFLHIFNHSLMKGMAFLAAGNITHQTGQRNINNMQGLIKMMPITTISLIIALLGLGGVPGTNGFISKFVLLSSAIGANLPILAVIGVINVAISMAYYLRVVMALLNDKGFKNSKIGEAPLLMVGITSLMAVLIIVLGIFPNPILGFASDASKSLLEGLKNYIGAVLG